jgi:peptidoglycan/LPS O-acetylase OafA/YrhL
VLGLFLWLTTSVRENAARAIVAPIVPLLLAGTLLHPRAVAGRILEWGPLRWVGRISYSLYLWQQLFLVEATPATALVRRFPIDFVLTFACALASYYWVERPFLALKDRYFKKPTGEGDARPARGPVLS